MTQNRLVQIAGAALLLAFFFAVSFWRITESCLWFDEIFSVHAASQPWDSFLSFVALDLIHPPLFYTILKIWITVGGDSILWLRLLPLILAATAIAPLWLLLTELKQNFSTIAITYILLVFSGTFLKYSLEVRMYSLLAFLALTSTWLFVRFMNRGTGLFPLLLVNILLVYTHYFGWFVMGCQIIAILLFERKKILQMVMVAGATILAFLPWAIAVWNAADSGNGLSQNIGWMSRPGLREVSAFALNLIEPFYYQTSTDQPLSVFWITIPLLLIMAATATKFVTNWNQVDVETRKTIQLLAIFILLPLIAAFTVSWLSPYSIWGTRHLIIVFVPFYILVSVVFSAIPNRSFKLSASVAGLLLFGAAAIIQFNRDTPKYAWCQLGPLTADISDSTTPLYTVEDLIAYHLWFERRNDQSGPAVIRLDNIDGVREDKAYFLPRGFDDVKRIDLVDLKDDKLWLVHRAATLKESEPPLRNLIVKGYQITSNNIIDVAGEQIGLYRLER